MRLQVTYWDISCETANKTAEVDVEFERLDDYDFVPYGEGSVKRDTSDYDVFVYGDIPEEIKESIIRQFDENRKFYSGRTKHFEFDSE